MLASKEPGGFGQVGCVNTAQGFECDRNGVILGPDLVWRGDHVASDVGESKDSGFRGTVICSTDPETQAMLVELTAAGRLTR